MFKSAHSLRDWKDLGFLNFFFIVNYLMTIGDKRAEPFKIHFNKTPYDLIDMHRI